MSRLMDVLLKLQGCPGGIPSLDPVVVGDFPVDDIRTWLLQREVRVTPRIVSRDMRFLRELGFSFVQRMLIVAQPPVGGSILWSARVDCVQASPDPWWPSPWMVPEVNSGEPGGIGIMDVFGRTYAQLHPWDSHLVYSVATEYGKAVQAYIRALPRPSQGVVVVAGTPDSAWSVEYLAKTLRKVLGVQVLAITRLKDFRLDERSGKLYWGKFPVGLLVRQASLDLETLEALGIRHVLVRAILSGLPVFPHLAGRVVGMKSLDAIYPSPMTPRTVVSGTSAWEALVEKVARAGYVLKPSLGGGGKGVYFGRCTPSAEWQKLLKACSPGECVLQKEVLTGPLSVDPYFFGPQLKLGGFAVRGYPPGTELSPCHKHNVLGKAGGARVGVPLRALC